MFEGEYFYDKEWNGIGYDINGNKAYKLINGKGIVKEYKEDDGNLEFEGEYLNGERNGKGIEYTSAEHKYYEGEFKNGKKHGKGNLYYYKGNLLFEGEFLYNYKKKGKEYYFDGKLRFEGEYLYNKKWNGIEYDNNGNKIYELINGNGTVKEYEEIYNFLLFDGKYLNGKRDGKGKEYDFGKIRFDGEYLNGRRHGKGKEYRYSNFKFQAEEYSSEEGREKRIEYQGTFLIFDGEYINGKEWNGKGYDINNNIIYELKNGKWINKRI